MTSTPRSDMRLASSWIVIVSGIVTSRTSFFFFAAEALLGDFVGPALGFLVVTAALVLSALARLGGLALGALDCVALLTDLRLFLGDLAFFGLAHLRVAERMCAAVLLF